MQLAKLLSISIITLFTQVSYSGSIECHTGVLNLPSTHWLKTETIETQKQILLYLSSVNSYYCKREKYSDEIMAELEKAANTNSRKELYRNIETVISLIPNETKRNKIINIIGSKKYNELITKYTGSFDPIQTAREWGILRRVETGSND